MSTTTTPAETWMVDSGWCRRKDAEAYSNRLPKRIIDLAGATLLLLAALPLMALIALTIRLTSRGPIFYRQLRVGRDRRRARPSTRAWPAARDRRQRAGEGKPFTIIKFRTMFVDAESAGPCLSPLNDRRVTRLGRLLRATHLDELPQLWNVLRGDMSLVGPRPERPHFVRRYVVAMPDYRQRLQVRPGITGLAQLENGYDHSVGDVFRKLDLDLQYLEMACPRTDFRLLLRTFPHMLPPVMTRSADPPVRRCSSA